MYVFVDILLMIPTAPKDFDGLKAWRTGLEKFLMRVANHPVLSCTKVFHLFLTAKDDKVWEQGGVYNKAESLKYKFCCIFTRTEVNIQIIQSYVIHHGSSLNSDRVDFFALKRTMCTNIYG